MSKSYRLTACFLSLILLSACGGSGGNGTGLTPLNLNGRWIGSSPNSGGGTTTLDVTLAVSANSVSGSGSIFGTNAAPGGGITLAVLASGSFASPSVSLQLRSPPGANPSLANPATFTGTLTASSISGLYQGSMAMVLTRQ